MSLTSSRNPEPYSCGRVDHIEAKICRPRGAQSEHDRDSCGETLVRRWKLKAKEHGEDTERKQKRHYCHEQNCDDEQSTQHLPVAKQLEIAVA